MSQHHPRTGCVFDSRETRYTQNSNNTSSYSERTPEQIHVQWAQPVWDGTKWVYVLEQPPSPGGNIGNFHQQTNAPNGSFYHPDTRFQHHGNGSFHQPTSVPNGSFHQPTSVPNGSFHQPTNVPNENFHHANGSFHHANGSFHQAGGSFHQRDPNIPQSQQTFHNASFHAPNTSVHLNDLREQPEIFIDPNTQFAYPAEHYPQDRYPRWVTQILDWAYRSPRNARQKRQSTVRVVNENGEELPKLSRPDILPKREPSTRRHRNPNDDLPPTPPEQQRNRPKPNGIPRPPPHPHNQRPDNRRPSPQRRHQAEHQRRREQRHQWGNRGHPRRGHHPRRHQNGPRRWQDNFNVMGDDDRDDLQPHNMPPEDGYTEIGDVNYETLKWQRTVRKRMREKNKKKQDDYCCFIFPRTRLWYCLLPILLLIIGGGIGLALYINFTGSAPEPVPSLFMGGDSKFNVDGKLRLTNMQFVDSLRNSQTENFKNTEREFCDALKVEFYQALDSCVVKQFLPGSVIVFYTLEMLTNGTLSNEILDEQIKQSPWFKTQGLDPDSMSMDVREDVPTTTTTTTITATTTQPSTTTTTAPSTSTTTKATTTTTTTTAAAEMSVTTSHNEQTTSAVLPSSTTSEITGSDVTNDGDGSSSESTEQPEDGSDESTSESMVTVSMKADNESKETTTWSFTTLESNFTVENNYTAPTVTITNNNSSLDYTTLPPTMNSTIQSTKKKKVPTATLR